MTSSPADHEPLLFGPVGCLAMEDVTARLQALGITLPDPPRPIASYSTSVRVGDLLFTSGHGPVAADGSMMTGKVGVNLDIAAGQAAARMTTINLLATVQAALGSLDQVARIVKVLGFVNCEPTFTDHPVVLNGCSDLLVDVFGEEGRHVRSAVGVSSLPLDFAIEIEMVLQVR